MSNTILYEGYTIQSNPRYRAEWEKWQLSIAISFKEHAAMKPREYSSEVLYMTEQEAEIHGLNFGQHLIDGKVEGCSVTDMKIEKQRDMRRFHVTYPTTMSGPQKTEETGVMLDLSAGGCRMESSLTVARGQLLELRVAIPGLESSLIIDGARVQWVSRQVLGLAFVRIGRTERQRLDRIIADLRIRGSVEVH